MTELEKNHIKYLKQRKEIIIDAMIGACEEINAEIKEVQTGQWLKSIKGANKRNAAGESVKEK